MTHSQKNNTLTYEDMPTTWDLSDLFKRDDDPGIEVMKRQIQTLTQDFLTKYKEDDTYLHDSQTLAQALQDYEKWARTCPGGGTVGYYFHLRLYQDLTNTSIKAANAKFEEFLTAIQNDIQFFELKLGRVSSKDQKKFLATPELQPYRHFLQRLFDQAQYALSDKEERIMNMKAFPSHTSWVQMTENFLSKEERVVYTEKGKKQNQSFAAILNLMNNQKKEVRDSAADAFNDILAKHVEVAEVEINTVITNKKINDMIRGYPRPDSARHMADDIDTEVVDTLCEVVSESFNIPQTFYQHKAQLLNVSTLAYHERNVEVGGLDHVQYDFSQSVALVDRVFHRLDPAFSSIFNDYLRSGRIDVFPRTGKPSGAFCAHYLISHPTYILLNHTGTLRDVLTLAHELGHGINNEFVKAKQHSLAFGSPLSTAEVASTFMEDFVLEEIQRQSDEKTKQSLLIMKLNQDINTIFRQVAGYRFEQELHQQIREKGYLPKEDIGELFQKHMQSYMGPSVEQSPGSENWWVYWSHFRRSFYVYSYASGLLISKYMQRMVRKDPSFISQVQEFLSAGLSASPQEIFARMGIDIRKRSFWQEGVEEIRNTLRLCNS